MVETKITGKAWVGGDNISTYAIIPQRRWDLNKLDAEELSMWALEDADPAYADKPNAFKQEGCSIVIAGECFGGGGKSIEHPILALKGAGVKVVIADSFARFNFRNSVNNGLPVVTCKGIKDKVQKGDELTVDLKAGTILNNRSGETMTFVPLSDFVFELMEAGGLIPYTKAKIHSQSK